MKAWAIAYPATLAAFLALDFVWLSLAGPRLYRPMLGDLLAADFRLAPAIVFYLLYVAGLVYFAVAPQLEPRPWSAALLNGAFFGLVAYGTYDLTNQATLRHWPTTLTLADLAWGTLASGAAAAIARAVTSHFTRAG